MNKEVIFEIGNGQLPMIKDREYQITINNKNNYLLSGADNFRLKVITKDSCGATAEGAVTIFSYSEILAQWALDSVKNDIAVDSSGSGNNGIINGATLNNGILGGALEFDGVDDYVAMPLFLNNAINTNSFSVEAWIKTSDSPMSEKGVIGNYQTESTPYWLLIQCGGDDTGKFAISIRDAEGNMEEIKSQESLNDGRWHHLVGVRNVENSKISFYVDGVLADEADALFGDVNSGSSIMLGNIFKGCFRGCIDEVTLYCCALTAEQVRQKYETICFLENIIITNRHNDETTHPATFGSHLNKIEFELKKTVNKLILNFNLPSIIKIGNVEKISRNGEEIENPAIAIPEGTRDQIIIDQPLVEGEYLMEILLTIDQEIIVKTQSFSDEKGNNVNQESNEFLFELMDFEELPNLM